MPKFRFHCNPCDKDLLKFVHKSVMTYKCDTCGFAADRQMPNVLSSEVKEVIDPYTNVSWANDQQAMIKARREQHYWEVEVPRLVEKYSLQTCLEQGWLTYNDNKELVINKPPSKR